MADTSSSAGTGFTWNKKWIAIIAATVVVIAVVIYLAVSSGGPVSGQPGTGVAGSASPASKNPAVTRAPAPAGVAAPDKGAQNVPQNVATPQVEAVGSPSGNSKYRSFNIQAVNNSFVPNTVIVNLGDTIDLEITAVDKNYDFYLPDFGNKSPLPKGETKRIQTGATAVGKFTFYCVSCGGPQSGPIGYLEVVNK